MTGICPSFTVEKKIAEAMKAHKGHLCFSSKWDLVFFCFKIDVGFCEHLSLSFRKFVKIGVCFSKLREFP